MAGGCRTVVGHRLTAGASPVDIYAPRSTSSTFRFCGRRGNERIRLLVAEVTEIPDPSTTCETCAYGKAGLVINVAQS